MLVGLLLNMKIIEGLRVELDEQAANLIYKRMEELLLEKEYVVLGVVGGRSVSGIYSKLSEKNMDWQRVKIFIADERLIGIDSEVSNYSVVSRSLPKESIVPFIYTRDIGGDLEGYRKELEKFGGKFDILILSSGEDGHIAGLFPDHETIRDEGGLFISTFSCPKDPPERMSSSKKLLLKSEFSVLVFYGDSKKEAFDKFNQEGDIENCPNRLVKKINESYVFKD